MSFITAPSQAQLEPASAPVPPQKRSYSLCQITLIQMAGGTQSVLRVRQIQLHEHSSSDILVPGREVYAVTVPFLEELDLPKMHLVVYTKIIVH